MRMHSYISIALIILLFPLVASAHGPDAEPHLDVEAGALPGETGYFFEKIGEWFEVNIFTVSTKQKQAKKLEFASERVVEFQSLLEKNAEDRLLRKTLERYQGILRSSQDMAEKIILLDGAEVEIGRKFEETTRIHEIILGNLLGRAPKENLGIVQEFLTTTRLENQDMFQYLVEHYQLNDQDIRIHQGIVQKHIVLVRDQLDNLGSEAKVKQILDLLEEAKKFKEAGLNAQAYQLADRAKNIVYSIVLQVELER